MARRPTQDDIILELLEAQIFGDSPTIRGRTAATNSLAGTPHRQSDDRPSRASSHATEREITC